MTCLPIPGIKQLAQAIRGEESYGRLGILVLVLPGQQARRDLAEAPCATCDVNAAAPRRFVAGLFKPVFLRLSQSTPLLAQEAGDVGHRQTGVFCAHPAAHFF